jgi:hypothetical protein
MSASFPTGKKGRGDRDDQSGDYGHHVRGLVLRMHPRQHSGSRPSRAITKKMRVWPNSRIRMTEGSAMKAA